MRAMRVLAVAVLAVVLALSSTQNAFAVTELSYDDATPTNGNLYNYAGVRFSLPSGVTSAHLVYVRWFDDNPSTPGHNLVIHVTGPDQVTELAGSPITLSGADPVGTGCPAWGLCYGLDITSYNIVVAGDFFVILYKSGTNNLNIISDEGGPVISAHRSFLGNSLPMVANPFVPNPPNLFIRVDIDPIVAPAGPVGGFMEPVNKLAVFAPYLALFGVMAVVAVVFWKRPYN